MAMTRLLLVVAILACAATASAQTSSFTYQGRLTNSSTPASGTFTIKFDLYDAAAGGNLLGTDTQSVTVTNGVFTVTLDFGAAAFDGSARFLEITVAGTTLSPRKPISSTPYAIQASNSSKLGGVDANQHVITTDPRLSDSRPASSINLNTAAVTGVLPIANGGTGSSTQNFVDLTTTQTITGPKNFSSASNTLAGNGAAVTNISPVNISAGTANINVDGYAAHHVVVTAGQSPAIGNATIVALNYAGGVSITDLTGGIIGRCVTLLAVNGNESVLNGGNFRLSKDWTPSPNDSLTVCRSNAGGSSLWYEHSRSERPSFLLFITKDGDGSGMVTSTPSGIFCGAACAASLRSGAVVSLTAAASQFSTFAGWGGACSGTGTCNVTMDTMKFVTATFVKPSFGLSVSRSGPGSVVSNPSGIYCGVGCSTQYPSGTLASLMAVPDSGASFGEWSGACSGASSSCTVTMDGNKTVNARFGYLLTVNRTGGGGGTVSATVSGGSLNGLNCGAVCSFVYNSGTVVTLTATPASGATFIGWSGAGCSGTGTCSVIMNQAHSVSATFTFPLSVSRYNNGGGSVTSDPAGIECGTGGTCAVSFVNGTQVTLTAMPNFNATFAGWTGCDIVSGTTCTVTMTSVRNVAARFQYPVNVANSGGGTVTGPGGMNCGSTCSVSYNYNDPVTLTATPAPNASLGSWSGCDSVSGNTCTVSATNARTVSATFTFPLSVTKTGAGTGTITSSPAGINCGVVCSASYVNATLVTLTPTPSPGSSFAGWSGACTGTGACNVTLNTARSVSATFSTP
jgi:hypothetical protein